MFQQQTGDNVRHKEYNLKEDINSDVLISV